MSDKTSFTDELDALGRSLMTAAKGTKVELGDKIAIFANMVKWAAVKNKLDPDSGEGNQWDKYGKLLNNDTGRAGHSRAQKKEGERPLASANAIPSASTLAAADSIAKAQRAGRFDESSGGNDSLVSYPKPESHSFPVLDRGVLSDTSGGTGASANETGGGRVV